MNILLITTTYPTPVRPRQGIFNRNLVDALRVMHDVRVIAPVPWTQRAKKSSYDDADHSTLEHFPTYYYPPKFFRQHYDRFYWHSILPTVKRIEKTFTPDLVMGYWLHPDAAAAQRAARRFHTPHIAFSGGSDLRVLTANPSRRRAIERVVSKADCLIVVSHDLEFHARELGTNAHKIQVIYRGVDAERFFPMNRSDARAASDLSENDIVCLWCGRLEPVKNPTMLLRAAVFWREKWGDRLKVILAGDGSMNAELRSLCSQLKLDRHVRFEGNLPHSELALRFNAADVTVLTSHSEGIPNVLLESIACGTPFVATDVGGVSEIASPNIDTLVADGDVHAFAKAVIERVESSCSGKRRFIPDGLAEMASRFDAVFREVTQ
ncbi:putative teichuronic acid biosynthesis glycosyltransferase TuaC [Planctomycetes bacterium CA13]|uniref:Putative teichuronic acid biosynthesis glycosyltransferase TuaC n=1 Tax=Novipirellula herctigrandis TaxID=2527986 RepID=A0A5C5Z6N1_9BACT|nr:putative teichuronic acid biosynthesis glycosyltransferase TuaC [Planctomycetes bacterium CA13]